MKKRVPKAKRSYTPRVFKRVEKVKIEKDCKSFKFRIFPNHSQISELTNILSSCRELYNSALTIKLEYYEFHKKNLSYEEIYKAFKKIRDNFPLFKEEIHSQIPQDTLKRAQKTHNNFIKRCYENKIQNKNVRVGEPRLKSPDRYNSFTFPQVKKNSKGEITGGILLSNNLQITGVDGIIPVDLHRNIQNDVKTATILRRKDDWYIIFSTEKDKVNKISSSRDEEICALDAGLTHFMTKNNGEIIHFVNMKPYEEKASKKQSEVTRKKEGSKREARCKNQVNKAFEKIKNVRNDFLHKTSRKLVNNYNIIILEDLNIKNMILKDQENYTHMSKNIYRKSWRKFYDMLSYKAEEAGKHVIYVNSRNTSKTCNNCNNIKIDLSLKDREYICNCCNYRENRDVNAAKNILKLGLEILRSRNFNFQSTIENSSLGTDYIFKNGSLAL